MVLKSPLKAKHDYERMNPRPRPDLRTGMSST